MKKLLKSFMPDFERHLKNFRSVCGNRTCHHKQLMRSFPGGRPGIQVGPAWYCCVDCFAMAACAPLEKLCNRQVVEISRQPRLSLGLFLLSKGNLTAEQLRVATAQSQILDEDIEESLVKLGMVSEKALVAARSAQWGYPVLAPECVGQLVEVEIPKSILNACRAVPLHYSATAKRILVGFVSRVEHSFLESIEEMTGCRVEPCFITPTDFQEQMERVTAPPDYEEVVVNDPGSPERMARTVGRTAVHVAAREAAFIKWRNFVLVRVAGKRGKADIVFVPRRIGTVRVVEHSGIFKEAIAI
jgi:Type II secretion system (T2SS), protein E, N-terminal domain